MSWDHHNLVSPILPIRSESGETIVDPRKGGRVVNMVLTESGTLRSVVGPVEYHPAEYASNGGAAIPPYTYPTKHYGVCHALLEGGRRDVLLIHDGDGISVHEGHSRSWYPLIVPPSVSGDVKLDFAEMDGRVGFKTQFVTTPYGVVIVPQGDRAYFYDGTTVAPLGFAEVPGPPSAIGPKLGAQDDGAGDAEDRQVGYYKTGYNLNDGMGNCRLGSIRNDVLQGILDATVNAKSNPLGGVRQEGAWSAKLQWVDHWGNLSALSSQSSQVAVSKEDNLTKDRARDYDESAQRLRVQVAWADLDEGPAHCVAKNIYRTKDQLNSGIPGYFWVPPTSKASRLVTATMATPEMTIYPDNTPDEWLVLPAPEDIVPVPIFRLAALAFGRLWIANTLDQPGLVRASEPGFFGTFTSKHDVFPDANGAEVTGLLAVNQGLLVFTETSTFLIRQDDSGQSFLTAVLSTTVGCVAPDSAKVRQTGEAMWLGRDGFYSWGGEGPPVPVSMEIKETHIRSINKGWRRGAVAAVDPLMDEYRCWVPVNGSQKNNLCLVYDGMGWRERTDVIAGAVCVTRDHRQYMLALGTSDFGHNSLWVLDHDGKGENAWNGFRESYIETAWLRNTRSQRRGSPIRATLWTREGGNDTLDIQVMRDWREYPKLTEVGKDPFNYPDEDVPPFWGTAVLDSNSDDVIRALTGTSALPTHFTKRRPHWSKVDIALPSVETFRIRITNTKDWEFVGLIFDEQDRHAGGAKIPGGV